MLTEKKLFCTSCLKFGNFSDYTDFSTFQDIFLGCAETRNFLVAVSKQLADVAISGDMTVVTRE